MTAEEFLEELKTIELPVRRTLALRFNTPDGHSHCPITAVCEKVTGEYFTPMEVRIAYERLNMRQFEAREIIAMSDSRHVRGLSHKMHPELEKIRQHILSLANNEIE